MRLSQQAWDFIILNKGLKMLRKLKKLFFTGMFSILYLSFFAQLIYVIVGLHEMDKKMIALAVLSLEWLVLISARYLSKKSGNNNHNINHSNNHSNNNNNGFNGRRR